MSANRVVRLGMVVLGMSLLVANVGRAETGEITIDYAKIVEKDSDNLITSGYAQANHQVYFAASATCSCCSTDDLTYTWYFGDDRSANGQTVNHAYYASGAGTRFPTLCVECNNCEALEMSSNMTVYVLTGIDCTRVGENDGNDRLCFNAHVQVEAEALPAGLPSKADELIDWSISIGSKDLCVPNDEDPALTLEPVDWPTYNLYWGSGWLSVTIDNPSIPGQDDELITGAASFLSDSRTVEKFYDATGTQNPTSDPNWFYYYKQEQGGTGYQYDNVQDSHSTAGGGMTSVYIGNSAYTGHHTITYNHSNPGGRLRALGWTVDPERYYIYFLGVLAHETQHATNELQSSGGPTDPDGDYLSTTYETVASLTLGTANPQDAAKYSARGYPLPNDPSLASNQLDDGECYAGGPVEQIAINNAKSSHEEYKDWAQPGSQWP